MSRFTWLDTLEMVVRMFVLSILIFIVSVFLIYVSDLVTSVIGESFLDYLKYYFSKVQIFFNEL